jgi:hypothetical protein
MSNMAVFVIVEIFDVWHMLSYIRVLEIQYDRGSGALLNWLRIVPHGRLSYTS